MKINYKDYKFYIGIITIMLCIITGILLTIDLIKNITLLVLLLSSIISVIISIFLKVKFINKE